MASTSAWLRWARGLQLQRFGSLRRGVLLLSAMVPAHTLRWRTCATRCAWRRRSCALLASLARLSQAWWLRTRAASRCSAWRCTVAPVHSCSGAPHSLVVWGCSYDDGVVVDEDSQVVSVGGAPLDPRRVYVVGTARWEARSNKALHPYASAGWDCSFDPSQVHARVHCRYLVEHPEAMAGPDADYLVKALLLRYWGHTEDSSHCSDSG